MSIEAQSYFIPIVSLFGFALIAYCAYLLAKAKSLTATVRVLLWILWLIVSYKLLTLFVSVACFFYLNQQGPSN
jgi:hypothetical protein